MKKIILLIEDDQDHAAIITELLLENENSSIEKEIILIKDGKETIDYFQEAHKDCSDMAAKIDLILLDINLPKVNGMDVLKYLKGNPKFNKTPVVVLTTSSDKKTIADAYRIGADDFIQKSAMCESFKEKLMAMEERWLYCNEFSGTEDHKERNDKETDLGEKCKKTINDTVAVARNVTNKLNEISNISAGKNENNDHNFK